LERLTDDLDRKIKKGKERLDIDDKDIPLNKEAEERVNGISDKIQKILKQIEVLGEEGRVDESQQLMQVIDQLKSEKELILLTGGFDGVNKSVMSQDKRMKVCDICGAFLVVGDTDKRISSHLDGKQHIGFAMIRKTIEDFRVSCTLIYLIFSIREDIQKNLIEKKEILRLNSEVEMTEISEKEIEIEKGIKIEIEIDLEIKIEIFTKIVIEMQTKMVIEIIEREIGQSLEREKIMKEKSNGIEIVNQMM
jgi:hypothetical protein